MYPLAKPCEPRLAFILQYTSLQLNKLLSSELLLTVDPHSPAEFRCNEIVRNVDAFYEAFGVSQEDALWRDPAERVIIW